MSDQPVLEVRNIAKRFAGHVAVSEFSLTVPRGAIYGLLGPNGAGKTTSIRMIMNITIPDEGTVTLFGDDKGGRHHSARIGYLPEERGLYRKMKVIEMLEFQGAIKGARPPAARREAGGWLDRLELGEWKDRKVEDLSKGMQQKVQFVGAVMGRPELLILDEPFSGLDPVNQNLFKDVMLELNRAGSTIIFSTHQMDTAEKLCREIGLINRGRLVLNGLLSGIKERLGKNSVLVEVDGDGSFLAGLPGVARVDDYGQYLELRLQENADPQALLRASIGRVGIRRFEIMAPTLHSIFIEQVGKGETRA
jgi:ABC-2 type transport system ATP-binding protein